MSRWLSAKDSRLHTFSVELALHGIGQGDIPSGSGHMEFGPVGTWLGNVGAAGWASEMR